jgi:hypothetical protein
MRRLAVGTDRLGLIFVDDAAVTFYLPFHASATVRRV